MAAASPSTATCSPTPRNAAAAVAEPDVPASNDPALDTPAATDPFDEIDFGSFFDDYLDPGYKSPASESVEKPSFETFLSSPVTLGDHLRSQLSVSVISRRRPRRRRIHHRQPG